MNRIGTQCFLLLCTLFAASVPSATVAPAALGARDVTGILVKGSPQGTGSLLYDVRTLAGDRYLGSTVIGQVKEVPSGTYIVYLGNATRGVARREVIVSSGVTVLETG